MRVTWAPSARDDLRGIVLHIAKDNVDAALGMHDRIEAAVRKLDAMPRRARLGRLPNTRELVIGRSPYIAVFRVTSDGVEIARVIHGAQNWPPQES